MHTQNFSFEILQPTRCTKDAQGCLQIGEANSTKHRHEDVSNRSGTSQLLPTQTTQRGNNLRQFFRCEQMTGFIRVLWVRIVEHALYFETRYSHCILVLG